MGVLLRYTAPATSLTLTCQGIFPKHHFQSHSKYLYNYIMYVIYVHVHVHVHLHVYAFYGIYMYVHRVSNATKNVILNCTLDKKCHNEHSCIILHNIFYFKYSMIITLLVQQTISCKTVNKVFTIFYKTVLTVMVLFCRNLF